MFPRFEVPLNSGIHTRQSQEKHPGGVKPARFWAGISAFKANCESWAFMCGWKGG
ncbi:hypothetical protein Daudx_1086 [Candidatus Desulforudis audaxviator]|nr:hypothetical protein Daudx_1086 [Candidatus Desulforudis audaxviator]